MKGELEHYFHARSVQRGRALQRKGAVVDWWEEDGAGVLWAKVQGTQRLPYDVTVVLDGDGGIEYAECSCPVQVDCKHAVATFLEYRECNAPRRGDARVHGATRSPEPGGTPQSILPGHGSPPGGATANARNDRLVDAWCMSLNQSLSSHPNPARSRQSPARYGADRERIYSLTSASTSSQGDVATGVSISLLDAPRTAAGHFNRGRRVDPDRSYYSSVGELAVLDQEIEALGHAQHRQEHGPWSPDAGRYVLAGRTGQLMFDLALESGRCFIDTDRRSPVSFGASRELRLYWQATGNDSQRLVAELDGLTRWWLVPSDPPRWIDPHSATAGPIDTRMNGAQLLIALDAPVLSAQQLQRLADDLAPSTDGTQRQALPIPLPPVEVARLIESEPQPVLMLHAIDDNPHVDAWRLVLLMSYEAVLLPCSPDECEAITRALDENGKPVRVRRNGSREAQCFFELMRRFPGLLPLMHEPSQQLLSEFTASGETPAIRFNLYRRLVQQRNVLERDGWSLTVLPPVHVEPLRPGRFEGFIARADDAPGWFDIELGFDIDGVRHNLLQLVTDYIERGGGDEPLLIETAEGRFIEVPAEVLRPVAQTFLELGAPPEGSGKVRLSRARALALEVLERELTTADIKTNWHGVPDPFKLARQLRAFAEIETEAFDRTPTPRGLKATLRPYQRAGLGWLNTLAKHDLCGILADDMGLGKTLQTLAHILWLRQARRLAGPVLVVAPTSLLLNWAREARRFAPRLQVRVWHGLDRLQRPLDADQRPADLVITSYGLVLRDRDLLAGHGFDFMVLDEAQQIRNPQAKTTRAVKSLPIARRLCLSGTPLENHLGELWSQFDFLMPGLLGDAQHFSRHFRTPIERHGDTDRQQRLASAIAPFILRRRKEMVATELPPKTEMLREIRLGEAQSKLYESIRVAMQQRVRDALEAKGVAQSQITVLDALLKLRQLCCHPHLLKMDSARRLADSAKTTLALDMIDELVAEGRRILVFSSFTSMLGILERELDERGHRWVKLTGQTRKRDQAIDAFQQGTVPLFLISLKAGGTGLNLTAADTVILYDPWWNPAAEEQASARAHRIGQSKPVFVYRLVAAGTVEQRIVAMQQKKRDLANAMLEGGDNRALGQLSVEETLSLFDR